MRTKERDKYICQDYQEGMELNELGRTYGLSERRVAQILQENNIQRRPRSVGEKRALSAEHVRVGLRLYSYRFDRNLDPSSAAEDLGWSMIKLRRIENGTSEIELLDLLDIAAYTGIKLEQLLDRNFDG